MRLSRAIQFSVVAILLIVGLQASAWGEPTENPVSGSASRERFRMDFGWKFSLGHVSDVVRDFDYMGGDPYGNAKTGDLAGPPHRRFDDSGWETVDVPHDWGVAVGVDQEAEPSHGYRKIGRKYPENCIGWYRKRFAIPEEDEGKRLSLEFDGVFRDSRVWLNGHPVWHHESGYTSFGIDITDYVRYGDENTVVVRADASGYELWSYEGAGIYRHVWLVKTQPLHVARWGTCVTSEVSQGEGPHVATLTIKTTLRNDQDTDSPYQLISTIHGPDGRPRMSASTWGSMDSWTTDEITQRTVVENALLWSLESPNMYSVITTVKQGDKVVDTYTTPFGIRTFRFDPDKGFFLNGTPVKLKGVCLHQDHGGVGTAVPDRVQEYRVAKVKEMGANSIRTAHNWVAPEMLDACDRLGILVMDEARMSGSSEELLGQLGSMVRRDRNHPSVFMWCIGNEEHAIQGNETGARILRSMKRIVRSLDPVRPVTLAMNGRWGSVVTEGVDVQGCNYLEIGDIDKLHRDFPKKPIILSESGSTLITRGIYERDEQQGYCQDYDDVFPGWGKSAEEMWKFCAERDWLAGTFVWTGFDYGGEPLPDDWPAINSNLGIMDRACFPKNNFYYYQSWWSDETVLHLFPHWTWPGDEGEEKQVWCNSNCDEVELVVNGKSMGRKAMPRNSRLKWNVPYEPGYIEVRGYNGGTLAATQRVETTGRAAAVRLTPDRARIKADNQDVSMVTLEIVDAQGRLVPVAGNEIELSVKGSGKIIGVCNGDPSCHINENETPYPAFNGLLMVFVQAGTDVGPITLEATSVGLEEAGTIITAEECTPSPSVP